LLKGQFQIDFLMLVAATGAAILCHWPRPRKLRHGAGAQCHLGTGGSCSG
jgi:hypothetical protein